MFKHIRIEGVNAVGDFIEQLRFHETLKHWGW